mgnify:FL=1
MLKQIRNERANNNIANNKKINVIMFVKSNIIETLKDSDQFIKKLGGIETIEYVDSTENINENFVALHFEQIDVFLNLDFAINKEEEIQKLNAEKKKYESELKRATSMLNNKSFVEKAPAKLIEAEKEKIEKYTALLQKVDDRLNKLM